MNKMTRTDYLLLLLIALVMMFTALSTPAQAQEFGLFEKSAINERHRIAGVTSFGVSMGLYELDAEPEIAAPASFVITALAEDYQHNGAHGMTASEYRMIAFGSVLSYPLQKVLDHYKVPRMLSVDWTGDRFLIRLNWKR